MCKSRAMAQSPLRRWRGEKTLSEAAEALGVSVATLSRIERGRQWVSPETGERIRLVTGLTLDQLAAARRADRKPEAAA